MAVLISVRDYLQAASYKQLTRDLQWVQQVDHYAKNSEKLTQPAGEAEWSTGFFECFNPIDTCLITCCCPCITFGKTHHRLHKDPQLRNYSVVNASCLGWWATSWFGLQCIGTLLQGNVIAHRSQPKLSTNIGVDFLKSWCCHCCFLIQQDKEAEHLLAKEEQVVMQEPRKQEGMAYQAQYN
ncbi:MAG: hypothetical protein MMC23_004932 [Stictis urceolatum]|nr:hypothetical protein [Stictis urceolata]